jgi:hypothetical protein
VLRVVVWIVTCHVEQTLGAVCVALKTASGLRRSIGILTPGVETPGRFGRGCWAATENTEDTENTQNAKKNPVGLRNRFMSVRP